MRVLFTPYPSIAHFRPYVSLAWAFQNAGHEVRIAVQHTTADAVAAAGLTPVSLGDPTGTEVRNRDDAQGPKDPELVLRYADALGLDAEEREYWIELYQYLFVPIGDYLRPDLPEAVELMDFARAWQPDLVLWDATFPSGAIAAKVGGGAHARLLLGTDCFAWAIDRIAAHREQLRAAGLPDNPYEDLVRPLAKRYGVEVDRELLVGQWTVNPTPVGYGPTTDVKHIRMRHIPYNGGEVFPSWLHQRPQRPRVAMSLGESTRRFIPGDWDRTPRIMEAVADLDIEVVATLNDMQLQGLDRVPDNVRVLEWVPLTQLLPTCSVLLHHGGTGTFAAARAYRVPQIVCDTEESILIRRETPRAKDAGTYRVGREFGVRETVEAETPHWVLPAKSLEASVVARYITSHGAGELLNHRALTVEEIGKLILQVVNRPSYQSGASDIYEDWLATPSPADVVRTLETLTTNRS